MNELYHYGVIGMKWGVRRYQNPDGSLTERGKAQKRKTEYKQTRKELERTVRNTPSRNNMQLAQLYKDLSKNEYKMIPKGHSWSKARHMVKSMNYDTKSKEYQEKADKYYASANKYLEKAKSLNANSYLSYDVINEIYYLKIPNDNGEFETWKL